jgi:CubicO group peptidase (beta-lactamase class C family)
MNRKTLVSLFFAAALLAGLGVVRAAAGPPDYTPLIEKYRRIFREEMEKNHVAGLSVALVDEDRVVWCEGFGYCNAAYKNPVDSRTPFLIGSITKTFTGLAVMQLREQGRVDLDKPLRVYLPGFKMKTRFGSLDAVTVRSVMTHHAGIPDFIRDKFMLPPPPFAKVLDYVNNDYATFPPNTLFSYSNAGVGLLGLVVEKASGERYEQYLQQHILDPIGMVNAGFFRGADAPESVRLGYDSAGAEKPELPVLDAPAGCLYASAEDMAKYIQTFLGGGTRNGTRVFEASTLAEIMRVQNKDVFLDFGQPVGLIWSLLTNDAGRSIQHDGGTIYHRAEICISPEAGLGIVVLSNSVNGGKSTAHADYEIMAEAVKIKGLRPASPDRPVRNLQHPEHNFVYQEGVQPTAATLPRTELERRVGHYGSFGVNLNLTLPHESLKADLMGQTFYLLPVEGGEFVPSPENFFESADFKRRFYFDEVNGNSVIIQVDEWGNQSILAEKIDTRPPGEVWLRRVGAYNQDGANKDYQLFSDFRLEYQDGVLQLRAKLNIEGLGPPEIVAPLRVLGDNLAVVYGYSRFSGQAVQFAPVADPPADPAAKPGDQPAAPPAGTAAGDPARSLSTTPAVPPVPHEVMKVFGFRCQRQ